MKFTRALLLLALMACDTIHAEQPGSYDSRRKITVSGDAVVHVKPDKIDLNFGVETWDSSIVTAKKTSNEIVSASIAAIKNCGVEQKDIQTDQLSVEPEWERTTGSRQRSLIGYYVRNTLVVSLKDPAKVEELVAAALKAGVNEIHGINFQTTELKKYREQARELALKAAKEKADRMCAVFGQTVGSPLEINESYSGAGWGWWSGRSTGASQVNVQAEREGSDESPDTVAIGKVAVRAGISVTFEIEPQAANQRTQ